MKAAHRVGILGAGYVSEFHVAALRRVRNAEIVGVADLDLSRASALAKRLKLPAAYDSLQGLIEAGANVVHILTPPSAHADAAIRALEGGCHVLVEKPLGTSVADCQRIEAAAAAAKRSVCVNHSNLRDPFVDKAIKIAESGAIGDVIGADYFRSSNYPPYRGGRLPPQYREGGYPFRDMGVHGLYIIQRVLGRIEDVSAIFCSKGGDPNLLYDEWSAQVRCKDGIGRMRLSWNVQPLCNQLVIEGTKGTVRADMFAMYVTKRKQYRLPSSAGRLVNSMREALDIGVQVPLNVVRAATGRLRRFHGLQELVVEFYRVLTKGEPMPVTVGDATPIVEWTERIAKVADASKDAVARKYSRPLTARILVTGALGFIGKRLVERLVQQGQAVRILARREPPSEFQTNSLVQVVLGDLGDPDAVERAVKGVDVVYHVGAAMRGAAHEFERSTVVGTQNVVDSALRHNVQKFVYVSSLSVLHQVAAKPSDLIGEDWPLEPWPERRGAYSKSKLQAEQIVSEAVAKRNLPAVIFRPGQVIGPDAEVLTPAVGVRVKRSLIVFGNGKVQLPLVHVDDVVDALVDSVGRPVFDGSIFHLVDSATVTQNDLAHRTAQSARNRLSVRHLPCWILYTMAFGVQFGMALLGRSSPLSHYRLKSALSDLRFDCRAAKERLGWLPRVGVQVGLDQVFHKGSTATR